MNASVAYESGPQDWRPAERLGFQRAFRRARRHSRLVRLLRFGIPSGIAASLALYALALWLNPLAGLSLPSVGNVVISGTRVTMEVPRLAGYTRDGRGYEVTASAAAQDLKNPQFIELKELRAKIELDDDIVNVTAGIGFYDTKSETMNLRDNVLVKTTGGTEVRLSEANMDMRKGHVASEKPVEVDMPTAHVRANAMEVVDNGAVIVFRGGVTTLIKAEQAPATASAAPATASAAPAPAQTGAAR